MDFSRKSLLAMPRFPFASNQLSIPFHALAISSVGGFSTDSLCTLRKSPSVTVPHILSGCKVGLKQGRYTYRHDNILVGIVKCLQDFLATYSPSLPSEDDFHSLRLAANVLLRLFAQGWWLEIVFWFWGSICNFSKRMVGELFCSGSWCKRILLLISSILFSFGWI